MGRVFLIVEMHVRVHVHVRERVRAYACRAMRCDVMLQNTADAPPNHPLYPTQDIVDQ